MRIKVSQLAWSEIWVTCCSNFTRIPRHTTKYFTQRQPHPFHQCPMWRWHKQTTFCLVSADSFERSHSNPKVACYANANSNANTGIDHGCQYRYQNPESTPTCNNKIPATSQQRSLAPSKLLVVHHDLRLSLDTYTMLMYQKRYMTWFATPPLLRCWDSEIQNGFWVKYLGNRHMFKKRETVSLALWGAKVVPIDTNI